ncbi:hypothetical protein GCM10007071_12120 [Marinobacter zhanjiangensis]|uniref:Uncharacterized protein n=1 Tax=Marinobacter zhanjiangensis TaxID=578215 RepID=A0ABQ3AUI0_9GAMM|nr:hypothetical protein GCM10007071_12120 [Marinobacter zhanjiangensis]
MLSVEGASKVVAGGAGTPVKGAKLFRIPAVTHASRKQRYNAWPKAFSRLARRVSGTRMTFLANQPKLSNYRAHP